MKLFRPYRRIVFVAIVLALGLFLLEGAWASDWELTPFGGYQTGAHIALTESSSYDRLNIQDGGSYGLILGYEIQEDGSIEILWSRQESALYGELPGGTAERLTSLKIDQFRFDGLYYFTEQDEEDQQSLRPFVLAGLGMTHYQPGGDYSGENRFGASLGLGAKYYFHKRFGLRVDARWMPTVISSDSQTFCTGGGSGLNCSYTTSGSAVNPFEFTAGLIVRL